MCRFSNIAKKCKTTPIYCILQCMYGVRLPEQLPRPCTMYIVHACPGFVCSRDAMPGTESCSEIQKQRGSHKQSLLNMNEKCRAHTVIECVAVMCRMGPPCPRGGHVQQYTHEQCRTVYLRVVQSILSFIAVMCTVQRWTHLPTWQPRGESF